MLAFAVDAALVSVAHFPSFLPARCWRGAAGLRHWEYPDLDDTPFQLLLDGAPGQGSGRLGNTPVACL